jgi:glycosyltransferase involved in cell wall biosynthesis
MKHRCNVIVAYDPHILGLVGFIAARIIRASFVVRVISHYGLKWEYARSLSTPLGSRQLELAIERMLYRSADAVAVACPNHEDYVKSVGGPAVKLLPYVVAQAQDFYRTVDDRTFRSRKPALVVAVSRLNAEKFPSDLVVCASQLSEIPDLEFRLYGDGPLRGELEALALRLQAPVTFSGIRPQVEVRDAMEEAGAVVVLQGGGAIIEAALCGAAIVAYDYEMNPYVIREDQDEGWLVPFRDVKALATAIRLCLDNPNEARRRGERVRHGAHRRFGLDTANEAEWFLRSSLRKVATPSS